MISLKMKWQFLFHFHQQRHDSHVPFKDPQQPFPLSRPTTALFTTFGHNTHHRPTTALSTAIGHHTHRRPTTTTKTNSSPLHFIGNQQPFPQPLATIGHTTIKANNSPFRFTGQQPFINWTSNHFSTANITTRTSQPPTNRKSYRKEILFISEENHICQNSKLLDSVLDHFRIIALRFVNDDQVGVSWPVLDGVFSGGRGWSRFTGRLTGFPVFFNIVLNRIYIYIYFSQYLSLCIW